MGWRENFDWSMRSRKRVTRTFYLFRAAQGGQTLGFGVGQVVIDPSGTVRANTGDGGTKVICPPGRFEGEKAVGGGLPESIRYFFRGTGALKSICSFLAEKAGPSLAVGLESQDSNVLIPTDLY